MTYNKENIIEMLINTSKNIKSIYDNMNSSNKINLDYKLKLEITKENLLLDALDINPNNVKTIYNELISTLNDTLLDENNLNIKDKNLQIMFNKYIEISNTEKEIINDLILKRFESYLLFKFSANPIKTNNMILNNATISHAALIDYYMNVVNYLTDLEINSKSSNIKNKIISKRNRILFTDKQIEDNFFRNRHSSNLYNRCLINDFEKDEVNPIYYDKISELINDQYRKCYLYSNDKIKKQRNDFKIDLEILKAGLDLLDTKYFLQNKKNIKELKDKQSMIEITKTINKVINDKKSIEDKKLKY